uniref:Uncharacterized protein n=1 Tax=Daphnia galeata TaxID=27404 RepID=A0A8J2RBL2_9CRUS|nr:unnamed protein product [Daphnia galeata]
MPSSRFENLREIRDENGKKSFKAECKTCCETFSFSCKKIMKTRHYKKSCPGAPGTGSGFKLQSIMEDRRKDCAARENDYFRAYEISERKKLNEVYKRLDRRTENYKKMTVLD